VRRSGQGWWSAVARPSVNGEREAMGYTHPTNERNVVFALFVQPLALLPYCHLVNDLATGRRMGATHRTRVMGCTAGAGYRCPAARLNGGLETLSERSMENYFRIE
jgi:hypothetical protein